MFPSSSVRIINIRIIEHALKRTNCSVEHQEIHIHSSIAFTTYICRCLYYLCVSIYIKQ